MIGQGNGLAVQVAHVGCPREEQHCSYRPQAGDTQAGQNHHIVGMARRFDSRDRRKVNFARDQGTVELRRDAALKLHVGVLQPFG
jgi:hypothetical protein